MATYFHGNQEIQTSSVHEELQTLVLMNPTYVQCSHKPSPPPQPSNNLIFLNSANTLSPTLSHAPLNTQQFVAIPFAPNSHYASTLHGLLPRIHYNLYNTIDPTSAERETPRALHGLSLSLSSHQQPTYRPQTQAVLGDDIRASGGSASPGSSVTNYVSGMPGVLLSSKYLKAAQEVLDELVNVNDNVIKSELSEKASASSGNNSDKADGESSGGDGCRGGGDGGAKHGAELSTAERQEVQMKKAKFLSMLDEVEQRYRQYHHQMQIVISSFQQAAGIGSAKTYTAFALQTISKQFRCLKDAITSQMKPANKRLREEDCLGAKLEGSRLKFVNHHLLQQRALQQVGMIQNNAWKPQRGLPERSVSVLRAWLFEHFLHPYPKDSDKHMLAKQTGLSRSQVSNWFINARVRLWKPMVEEMYLEELKEQGQNGSEDKTSKSEHNDDSGSKDKNSGAEHHDKSFKSLDNSLKKNAPPAISISQAASSSPGAGNVRNQPEFSLIGSSEMEGFTQGSPKKQRSTDLLQSLTSVPSINVDVKPVEANNDQLSMKFGDERQNRDGYSFMGGQTNFIAGFGQCPIGEIGRFDAEQFTPRFLGNGVSLTLGLPHCEKLSLSGTHQSFLPNQNIQLALENQMTSEP